MPRNKTWFVLEAHLLKILWWISSKPNIFLSVLKGILYRLVLVWHSKGSRYRTYERIHLETIYCIYPGLGAGLHSRLMTRLLVLHRLISTFSLRFRASPNTLIFVGSGTFGHRVGICWLCARWHFQIPQYCRKICEIWQFLGQKYNYYNSHLPDNF